MIVELGILACGLIGAGMNVLALVNLARAAAIRRRYRENGEARNIHRSYVVRSSVRLACGVALAAGMLWPEALTAELVLLVAGLALVGVSFADWWAVRRAIELAHQRLAGWRGDGGDAA